MRRSVIAACTLSALMAGAQGTSAHPLSVSYSEFRTTEHGLDAVVRLPLDDMDLLLRLDEDLDETVTVGEIEAAREAIAGYLLRHIRVSSDGRPMEASVGRLGRWADSASFPYLEAEMRFGSGDVPRLVEITVTVLTDLYGSHRNLASFNFGEQSIEYVFQHGTPWSGRTSEITAWETFWSFLALGIEHIFTGYDHILFLFGLLLVSGGFKSLVAIVTSFTLAHSLTLALATLGVLTPVPWTIEAAIALSIAYVGAENFFDKDPRHRWRITFVFGLIHGFGFAGILRQMHLPQRGLVVSLFSFNFGVELGQVAIVALMYPVLLWMERSLHRTLIIRMISGAIVAVGLYWFFQRVR